MKKYFTKKTLNDFLASLTVKEILFAFVFFILIVVGYKIFLYKTEPKIIIGDMNYSQEELDTVREDILLENN